jgi:hypothetical protein
MVFSSELFLKGFMPILLSLYYLIADRRKKHSIKGESKMGAADSFSLGVGARAPQRATLIDRYRSAI